MDRAKAKELTDILVPWIQIVGLLVAGIYAIIEYRLHVQEVRVQRAVDHVTRLNSEELRGFNLALSTQHQVKYAVFTAKYAHRQPSSTEYYNFVMNDVLRHGQKDSLEPNVNAIMGYLDDGVVCAKSRLCDRDAVINNSGFGKEFISTYLPYLCYWRELYGDDTYFFRIMNFYSPAKGGRKNLDGECSSYDPDIKKTMALAQ